MKTSNMFIFGAFLFGVLLCNQSYSQQYYGRPYSNGRLGDCGVYGEAAYVPYSGSMTNRTRTYYGGTVPYDAHRTNACPQEFGYLNRQINPARIYSSQYAPYSSCPNQSCTQQEFMQNNYGNRGYSQHAAPFQRDYSGLPNSGVGSNQNEFADQRPQLPPQNAGQLQRSGLPTQDFQNSPGTANELIPPPQLPAQNDSNLPAPTIQPNNSPGTYQPEGARLIPTPNVSVRLP